MAELVQVVCGLILPRLILINYGSAYNGITSSAKQFLSAISILTLGVTGSTRVALYKSLGTHDNEKTSAIVRATEKYLRKVGTVLLVYLIALTILYPIFVDTGYSWFEVAPLIIAAGISASGRYFFGMTYNALLTADQSLYVSNLFSIASNILNVVLSVILIKFGCNIQAVKLSSSLALLMNPILRAFYVRRKYKLDKKAVPDTTALSQRGDVMAHSIANIVHDHTDVIVLTVFCNVKIVSVYATYNLVMNALKKTQRIFTVGTEAVFGNMWVKGEIEKIKLNLRNFEYIMSSFASVVFSTASVLILPFISLYTKGVHDVEYILPAYALVIIAAQMLFSLRAPYLTLVQGIGHYKQTKKGAYAEAIINIVVSVILVQFIGIVGVAVGTLIANLFRTVQYALYIDNHIIPRGKYVFVLRILWTISNISVVYLIANPVVSQYAAASWKAWVITAAGVMIMSVALTLISSVVFYRKDLKSAIGLLQKGIFIRTKKR